jgi:hypothetical protein
MAKQSSSLHKSPSQEVFCTVTRCLATAKLNNHPHEDLATFDYVLDMKIEKN